MKNGRLIAYADYPLEAINISARRFTDFTGLVRGLPLAQAQAPGIEFNHAGQHARNCGGNRFAAHVTHECSTFFGATIPDRAVIVQILF
jgi:hypothetical protein